MVKIFSTGVIVHADGAATSNQSGNALCEGQGGDRAADGGPVAKRIARLIHHAHRCLGKHCGIALQPNDSHPVIWV